MLKLRGITLLEVLISIAVMAVVATILMLAFGSFRAANDLTEAHSNIIGILKDARGKTLSSEANSNYGVHFETSKTALFKGPTYNASDPTNDTYTLPQSVEISSISLTGGATDAVFTRLQGTTTASGAIIIQSKRNLAKRTITIYSTGNVK